MKCPNCQHQTSDKAILQCSHCGEAFERGPLEEYEHLEYLADWLADRSEISYSQITKLLDVVEKKQDALIKQLLPKVETKPAVEIAPTISTPLPKPEPTPIPAPVSTPKLVTDSAPIASPAPKTIIATQPKPITIHKPPAPPKPVAPPKPKRPPVDWRKVITDAVTSGALLRALLYLGAFMIVISATVLVIRFWDKFNPILQLLFIASVPLLFYAGGWIVRTRIKLTQAGTVLTGIGATLVAVDFAAIYQLGQLPITGPVYWLIASIFCTALYVFTATRVKGEFFAYLTLIGGGGVLFAFTSLFKSPLQWEVVSVTVSSAIMTLLIARFNKDSEMIHEFARASRYLPQILMPVSVWYVSYSPAQPPTAQMTAFLFATIGYSALAWQFPTLIFAYTSLAASIGTVLFSLRVFDLPVEWYAAVASALALIYILIGQRISRTKSDSKITSTYVKALNTTGYTLIVLASISGLIFSLNGKTWAGVTGMTLAALDLAICAYIFDNMIFTVSATGLFVPPFSIALIDRFHALALTTALSLTGLTFAWHILSLTYISVAALLNKTEKHNIPLYLWAHILTPMALLLLPFGYLIDVKHWISVPTLSSLGAGIVVYLFSFVLQDSGRHTSLNKISTLRVPLGIGKSIFLWIPAFLIPIEVSIAWNANNGSVNWLGAILSAIGFTYVAVGQGLHRRAKEYRLPLHIYPYFFFLIAILTAIGNQNALLVSLGMTVISLGWLAHIYNRVIETTLAGVLSVWFFTVALDLIKLPRESYSLVFALLACLVYIPVAIRLNKFQSSREHFHPLPIFVVGYALSVYALYDSILRSLASTSLPWISAFVPLIVTALYAFSEWYFKDEKYSLGWAWLAAITFAITFRQTLTLFHANPSYDSLAWVLLAAVYLIVDRVLVNNPGIAQPAVQKDGSNLPESKRFWLSKFHLPLLSGLIIISTLSLILGLPNTFAAFNGAVLKEYLPIVLAQFMLVILMIVSARVYQTRLPIFIEPVIAFLPVTLFFIGYDRMLFGQALTTPQYAYAWTGLGIVHLIAAFFTDRAKVRYAHGFYLGAYVLITWSALWSILETTTLTWTFGVWILTSVVSAILIHVGRHQTWNELGNSLFGKAQSAARIVFTNLFQWLATWTFPVWLVICLYEIKVPNAFIWLGFAVPPLAYLVLGLWLRRINASYASSFFIPAQFYMVIALAISVPVTLEFFSGNYTGIERSTLLANILLQTFGVIFYIASARIYESLGFSHIASWLSIIPFTIAWRTYGFEFTYLQFVIPWLLWSTLLIVIGFVLDKNKIRYSYGPYTAGYLLSAYALIASVTHRITNIYALAITITLALISHIIVHYGRHHTYEDFLLRFWQKTDATTRKIVSTFFLFFVAYATPVLIAQILAHLNYELAWRGVILAIAAPLSIAIGLWTRSKHSRSLTTVPSWALFSAGYLLTAIGAMVSFENETLAIWVFVLNTVVYGVSAYIFRQAFWLYLSTVLTPVIALLILHHTDHFTSNWSSWVFIGFAYLYLVIGQIFDRKIKTEASEINPFASAFYAPGFLLSAIALALSSNDRTLALQIYPAGVILYALSGWLFKETLFIYPAAWLAAVPYYLTITLSSLETRWYGLAWLPLIIAYIAIGKFIFHKQPLAKLGQGMLVQWFTHPAVPLYLLAYALSISMISLSYVNPLAITIAFGVAALLYFGSAFLFRTPGWIYASLFAAHMTLLTYFTINPKGGEAYYLSIPFHALTWLMALLGLGFSRWKTGSDSQPENEAHRFTLIQKLVANPWARPFFIFTLFDTLVWQSIALYGYQTTLIVAIGNMVLFALFSIIWSEGLLVYGAIAFGLLAVGSQLRHVQFGFSDSLAVYGGIGFGLYLLARLIEPISNRFKTWTVWLTPLTRASIALTALAAIINIPFMGEELVANAATLAFAGALYVTIAYREKQYMLGYLGMALLEAAWVIVLFLREVTQPQFYAIPGGLYFMAVAYLELQRERRRYATAIEILGIGGLMVPTFVQSLNGKQGFPYFVILMIEALLILWWGTLQKRKIPFFAGVGTSALNIFAQVIVLVNVYNISIWLVAFGVGLIIMAMAIYIERSREQLRARAQELSETLERWE